jgi:hypothetical protein
MSTGRTCERGRGALTFTRCCLAGPGERLNSVEGGGRLVRQSRRGVAVCLVPSKLGAKSQVGPLSRALAFQAGLNGCAPRTADERFMRRARRLCRRCRRRIDLTDSAAPIGVRESWSLRRRRPRPVALRRSAANRRLQGPRPRRRATGDGGGGGGGNGNGNRATWILRNGRPNHLNCALERVISLNTIRESCIGRPVLVDGIPARRFRRSKATM